MRFYNILFWTFSAVLSPTSSSGSFLTLSIDKGPNLLMMIIIVPL